MTMDTVIGEGVYFTRIARITGYLAKTSRFNDAKYAELTDRVHHDNDKFVAKRPEQKIA